MTTAQKIALELSAVIVSVTDGQPRVVVTDDLALPSGPLETQHEKLEQALRSWVTHQSGLSLGYVEQLYTFADKNRETDGLRIISIGYLALAQELGAVTAIDWYQFFPWEDRRAEKAEALGLALRKNLALWKNAAPDAQRRRERQARINIGFPKDPRAWNEELVLQRYELLWEAGLIDEAARGNRKEAKPVAGGLAMKHDHRRILATAMARLRAKIKYRPVVFELLPPRFTLLQLQNTVEALAGLKLHKQNFRRLVLSQGLVEETNDQTASIKGRPAKLFAFRREIMQARAAAGTKLPRGG
ncbi:MAG: hypothetical protein WC612_05795 [Bdellovibrionales bacterium]|jgi:hypothetical protein